MTGGYFDLCRQTWQTHPSGNRQCPDHKDGVFEVEVSHHEVAVAASTRLTLCTKCLCRIQIQIFKLVVKLAVVSMVCGVTFYGVWAWYLVLVIFLIKAEITMPSSIQKTKGMQPSETAHHFQV